MTYLKMQTPRRYGDWMQTYSGRQFWPLDARHEEIEIADIAHSLSMQCRFGGHTDRFYSVAEHSELVSRVIDPRFALEGLLHDGQEAYLSDVIRPIKRYLTNYEKLEQDLWLAIVGRFDLNDSSECHAAIKAADNAVLNAEKAQIMKPSPAPWNPDSVAEPADVAIVGWMPPVAKGIFLNRFKFLMKERDNATA